MSEKKLTFHEKMYRRNLLDIRAGFNERQRESLQFMLWDGIDLYEAIERVDNGESYCI